MSGRVYTGSRTLCRVRSIVFRDLAGDGKGAPEAHQGIRDHGDRDTGEQLFESTLLTHPRENQVTAGGNDVLADVADDIDAPDGELAQRDVPGLGSVQG